MQESEERQGKDSLVFKNKQKQLLLVTATCTFHSTSAVQQNSFLSAFSSELGRRNPGFGRRRSQTPTHWSNIIGSVLQASNTSGPRETLVPAFPSSHQGVLFAKGFGCSWRSLSLFSLKAYFVGLECCGVFPLSSPRCFWFSGCTPVKLGH